MNIEQFEKASFVVVGKKGSTSDGAGFIQRLWDDANSHFGEVQYLAKRDEKGNLMEIWELLGSGEQCLTFPGPFFHGKTSVMGFT